MRSYALVLVGLVAGCAPAEPSEEEEPVGETTDELKSGSLAETDMVPIPAPRGMPRPWDQPDSTGWFGERGKCGQTATANLLALYNIHLSPQDADKGGVHWIVGSRDVQIRDYLQSTQPQLHCDIHHPDDGPQFLRQQLAAGHPVAVWFNTRGGFLQSHWVTVAGVHGTGDAEFAVVMSWGRYYKISMKKLALAWERVYFTLYPSVSCTTRTGLVVH